MNWKTSSIYQYKIRIWVKIYTYFLVVLSMSISSCSNEFDGKDGIKTIHFPNSKLIKQIVGYKDGKREGPLKEYYRNGQLKVSQFYHHDTLTDSSVFYYENGNIQLIQYIKNRKKEGSWKKFNEQGKLYEEINYKDDERDGYSTKYSFRSLKLLERLHYADGELEGKQEFFYLNGNPKAITYSYASYPCLGTEEWDESGKKINNDFTISVREENKLLLTGKFIIHIKLSNPKPDDEVNIIKDTSTTNCLLIAQRVTPVNDDFIIEYRVFPGNFVMETLKIAAIRRTELGNKFVKLKTINVSANNY